MFRPYIGHPQALQEDTLKNCLCFIALWDPKCLTSCKHLGSHNAKEHNFWICLLVGPEDDLIRSKHVTLTEYNIFVYK